MKLHLSVQASLKHCRNRISRHVRYEIPLIPVRGRKVGAGTTQPVPPRLLYLSFLHSPRRSQNTRCRTDIYVSNLINRFRRSLVIKRKSNLRQNHRLHSRLDRNRICWTLTDECCREDLVGCYLLSELRCGRFWQRGLRWVNISILFSFLPFCLLVMCCECEYLRLVSLTIGARLGDHTANADSNESRVENWSRVRLIAASRVSLRWYDAFEIH
jgi:hypothetical protein